MNDFSAVALISLISAVALIDRVSSVALIDRISAVALIPPISGVALISRISGVALIDGVSCAGYLEPDRPVKPVGRQGSLPLHLHRGGNNSNILINRRKKNLQPSKA